jgi:hypothetical protein
MTKNQGVTDQIGILTCGPWYCALLEKTNEALDSLTTNLGGNEAAVQFTLAKYCGPAVQSVLTLYKTTLSQLSVFSK